MSQQPVQISKIKNKLDRQRFSGFSKKSSKLQCTSKKVIGANVDPL